MWTHCVMLAVTVAVSSPFDTPRSSACRPFAERFDWRGKPNNIGPPVSGLNQSDREAFEQKAREFEKYRYEYQHAPFMAQKAREVDERKAGFVAVGKQVADITQEWESLQSRVRTSISHFAEACDAHRSWLEGMAEFSAKHETPKTIAGMTDYASETARLHAELTARPSKDASDAVGQAVQTEVDGVLFDLARFAEKLRAVKLKHTEPDPAFVHATGYIPGQGGAAGVTGRIDCGPHTGLKAVAVELPAFADRIAQLQPRLLEMTRFLTQLRIRRQMVVEDITAVWLSRLDEQLRASVQAEAEDVMSSITSYLDLEKDYLDIKNTFGQPYEKARSLLHDLHCPLQARRIIHSELTHIRAVESRLQAVANQDLVKWQLQWVNEEKTRFHHLKAGTDALSRPGKVEFHNSRRLAMLAGWEDAPYPSNAANDCYLWREIAEDDNIELADQDDQEVAFLLFHKTCRKGDSE